ncbi:MAG: tyrosine-type recombinase/integrase [Mycobacterium sp.]|uniref:tyrosine-type recombinase/integrase n=1 Tax=Mycobacterium sp. TaxID=1785 RepID=UPI003CC56942
MSAPPTHRGMTFPAEILNPDEARRLLLAPSKRAPTGVRNRALIAVMYGAGLRVAETLALKPSDVDTDAASIRILHGKGDKARLAGIDEGALLHVARWIDTRRGLGIKGRVLFCTLNGTALSPRYVRAMLKRMADRVVIDKRVHPHGLRHTHAAELERDGLAVSAIQQQLGHRNLSTTAIYLNHISPTARIATIRERRSAL